ncbi:MAG: helix-hairpin-helix domain-containing protein [Methanosphaera sp.]|nr:helix-hairpin-helix domain-containing protein [Methanosphaera sp.]
MEENSMTWKIVNLLWAIFSFIFLLNGIGIIYAGRKANNNSWLIEGIIYQIFPTALLLLAMFYPNASFGVTLAGIYLFTWAGCIIRTFFIARRYLDYMKNNGPGNNTYNPQQQAQNNYQNRYNTQNLSYDTTSNVQYNNSPNNNGSFDQESIHQDTIPSTDTSNSFEDNKQDMSKDTSRNIPTVDINTATIEELALIPSMDIKQAETIIRLRDRGEMINSLDDLKQKLNLNDSQVNQMKDYVNISTSSQRRIDL